PTGLTFNKKSWDIPATNQILIAKKFMDFKDFVLGRNQQKMTLSNAMPNRSKEHLGIRFENFSLATFTSLLNPDETLANGILEGNLIMEDPFGDTGIVAEMNIDKLSVMGSTLGDLTLNANSAHGNTYDFDLSLSGGDADLEIKGDYLAAESGAKLNLDVLINEIKVNAIQTLAPESFSEPTGSIAGEFKVNGTLTDPEYKGNFRFRNAGFKVNSLNTQFTLAQEDISMDNLGVYFDHFTITDANDNQFRIEGKVLTEDLANPSFDLVIKAKDFQALNATKEDNDLFFGNLKLDTDLQVKGNLSIPIITGNLKIVEGSELTFVVPESQLEVMERDGVVLFVNREDPNSIMTKDGDEGAATAIFKGYDINTLITVDDNSIFTIVIDERSGDNFQIKGKGDFTLGIDPNGLTSLSGRYELSDGHYEASLYNLVKRRFDISPGSSLTWSGDPFNANLDVRAIYRVETSAAPLMATQTSASSAGTANKYRQELPFLVYLNVDGVLLLPEISFDLDMPEDEQGSLGGEVYGRVMQLNEREEELNKQVFSLLVLNRFFPGSTSDGSSGGAASIARDNVNKVLSGQLNQFSDKLVGNSGIDLDFGLDSFTDYQGDTPQDRTQLDISASKRLFNNRLIVQMGGEVDIEGSNQGQEGTPMIGNVSLEYLLTENGRFRLKGFRKNEFESVIDGQLIVTGIALIFNREFNQFKELFKKTLQEEADKENKATETELK
ncbi:MAG TPA: translocation/assembly module TamB domain-containing protein, partial [Arenibacter sp.]|nr:translocation/assembly module TamB domain-containing protein [Arenibacter sp.]